MPPLPAYRVGMTGDRVTKLAAAASFVLLAVAVMTAWNSPATAYEASIYTATPLTVWLLLGISLACGIAIIVHQVHTGQQDTSRLWAVGLFLILLNLTVVLSLYVIRGYGFWNAGGDSGTLAGWVSEIISGGHVRGGHIYPLSLIYTAQFSHALDVSPLPVMTRLPIIFALVYAVFVYLLANAVLPRKGAALLATVAALLLLDGPSIGFFSNVLANLLIPMVLFLLIRSYREAPWQWKALFVLMVVVYPLFHPVPTAALAVILITVPLAKLIFDRLAANGRKIIDGSMRFTAVALVALVVWGGVWFSGSGWMPSFVDSLAPPQYSAPTAPADSADPTDPTLITDDRVSHIARLISQLRYARFYDYSVARQFFRTYGSLFLYTILTLLAFVLLWRRTRRRAGEATRDLASLYGPLAGFAVALAVLFLTAAPFGPMRLLFYVALLCSVCAGFVLFEFREWVTSRLPRLAVVAACVLAVLFISVSVAGILRLYPSPYTLVPSYQATRTEISGMSWLFSHNGAAEPATYITGITAEVRRFADFLLTRDQSQRAGYSSLPMSLQDHQRAPNQFGYDTYSMLGQSYDRDMYLVLTSRDRVLYTEVWPDMAEQRFSPSHFARLEVDPTVDKLYANSGLDVYHVRGIAPQPDTEQ